MAASPKIWRDYIWLVWFIIQIPVITCIDAVELYPDWLWVSKDSPLHFLHTIRQQVIQNYNDPFLQWTPDSHMTWAPLFARLELFFGLPAVLYGIYRLSGKKGTTGPAELLLLVYSFEVALTTAICINDVSYWDPKVYSPVQKNMFRYQLFGPWFFIPTLIFIDMYSRLLGRFNVVDRIKKTQ